MARIKAQPEILVVLVIANLFQYQETNSKNDEAGYILQSKYGVQAPESESTLNYTDCNKQGVSDNKPVSILTALTEM